MQPQPSHSSAETGTRYLLPGVELQLTSALHTRNLVYSATGVVRLESPDIALEGVSVRIRSLMSGLTEEAFVDAGGFFAGDVELQPETDNALEFAVCDDVGREMGCVVVVVRHQIRDGERAIEQHLAEPKQTNRAPMLDPPWPRFAQLVQSYLNLAAEVAEKTGRDVEELCDHIHTQERYAEHAFEERNQTLYCECRDNLENYGGYLKQLLGDTLPRPSRPNLTPEEEARTESERFRTYLSAVWKKVREKQRPDLETRLREIASEARGLSQRVKNTPLSVLRETNRLRAEVEKVAQQLRGEDQP